MLHVLVWEALICSTCVRVSLVCVFVCMCWLYVHRCVCVCVCVWAWACEAVCVVCWCKCTGVTGAFSSNHAVKSLSNLAHLSTTPNPISQSLLRGEATLGLSSIHHVCIAFPPFAPLLIHLRARFWLWFGCIQTGTIHRFVKPCRSAANRMLWSLCGRQTCFP